MQISIIHGIDRPEIRKRLLADGTVDKNYIQWPDTWWGPTRDVPIQGITALYDVQPSEALCLGAPSHAKSYLTGVDRKNWVLPPTDVIVLDVDGMPYVEGHSDATLIADPEGTIRAQMDVLFGCQLREVYHVVALSSSSGFTGDFRAHVWIGAGEFYAPKDVAAWTKTLNDAVGGFLDTGIFQASRMLFAHPPKLDGPDPLPRRVFEFKGERGLQLLGKGIQPMDGTVPLTKHVTRGKHNLYQMNMAPLYAGEGGVSQECWNFVLSCKRAGMTEDDAVEAMRATLLRIEVPRVTWKRMWLLPKKNDTGWRDPVLGLVRRMYRDIHAGMQNVFGLPAYREPDTTLGAAVDAMRAAVVSQVQREGVFLNKVTLGAGKTHEIVDFAVNARDKKVLIVAPNHDRCNEIVKRLEAARTERLADAWQEYEDEDQLRGHDSPHLERPWSEWRGRTAQGMCSRLDAVSAAFSAGVNVATHVCGFPTTSNPDGPRCPAFARCAYVDQVMGFWNYNWVVPVAMITHLSRVASEADVIIVDEGCVDLLAGLRTTELEELLAPRPGRLGVLSRRAHADLLDGERRMSFDELNEALELDLAARPSVEVMPDMGDDEIMTRCDLKDYRKGCVSIWRALLAEHAGGKNHLHVFYNEEELSDGTKGARWRAQTSWRTKPRLLTQAPTVLLFDATPNEVALKAHFPNLEVFSFDAPKLNTRVVQVYDAKGKRSTLINDLKPTDPKFSEADARIKENRRKIAMMINAQPGYTIVVTKKQHREALEKEFKFPRAAFAHHGAVEGQDSWVFGDGTKLKGVEVDNLIVVGRNAPLPWVLEAMARPHHCDEEEIVQMGGWYREEHCELANGIAGYRLRHDDARVDAVLRSITVDGQMQAVGRLRSVRRSKVGRIFVLHSMRLDIEVTECVSSGEMMRRVGDVTLLSASEVDRLIGFGGRSTERLDVKATHKYRTRDKKEQPKPFSCRVAVGADVDQAMRDVGAVWWEAVGGE